ncbi:toxin glutamine deamidase domain-containing protein [Kitasatospora sp. NPDC049285]|uniref:toxin glutamine deamidase domain-containing protein n=1 Tax=Kitasatospora sp. NPDC049285 TaxID=3157096 RepID=UPI003444F0F7
MSRKLPEELAPALARTGHAWPQADEDGLRQAAGLWREFGTEADRLVRRGGDSAQRVAGENSGAAVEAFAEHWRQFSGGGRGQLDDASAAAGLLAGALDKAAGAVDHGKAEIIAVLTELTEKIKAADAAEATAKAQIKEAGQQATSGIGGLISGAVGATVGAVKEVVAEVEEAAAVESAKLKIGQLLEQLGRDMAQAVKAVASDPAVTALERIAAADGRGLHGERREASVAGRAGQITGVLARSGVSRSVEVAGVESVRPELKADGTVRTDHHGNPVLVGTDGLEIKGVKGLTITQGADGQQTVVGADGSPVTGIALGTDGKPLLTSEGKPLLVGLGGALLGTGVVMALGADGHPKLGSDGHPVLLGADGSQVSGLVTDPKGHLLSGGDGHAVTVNAAGQALTPDGRTVVFGADGSPIALSGTANGMPVPGLDGAGPSPDGTQPGLHDPHGKQDIHGGKHDPLGDLLPGGKPDNGKPVLGNAAETLTNTTSQLLNPDPGQQQSAPAGSGGRGHWDQSDHRGAGNGNNSPVSYGGSGGGSYGGPSGGGSGPSGGSSGPDYDLPIPPRIPGSLQVDGVHAPPAPSAPPVFDNGDVWGGGGGGSHRGADPVSGGFGGSAGSSGGGSFQLGPVGSGPAGPVGGVLPGAGAGLPMGGGPVGGGPVAGAPVAGAAGGGAAGPVGAPGAAAGAPGAGAGAPGAAGGGAAGPVGVPAAGAGAGAHGQGGGSAAAVIGVGQQPVGGRPVGGVVPPAGGGGIGQQAPGGPVRYDPLVDGRRRDLLDDSGLPVHPGQTAAAWLVIAGRAPGQAPLPAAPVRERTLADGRPYGLPGGLGPVDPAHQAEVVRRTPVPAPDPMVGEWIEVLNGGGPAESGRSNNCVDVALSAVDTLGGTPTCAAPRLPDGPAGERGGRDRAERELGTRFLDLGDGSDAHAKLGQALLAHGTGTRAVLLTVDGFGRSHTWNAVNREGVLSYLDHQTGYAAPTPLYPADHGLWAIAVDAADRPIDLTLPLPATVAVPAQAAEAVPAAPEPVGVAAAPAGPTTEAAPPRSRLTVHRTAGSTR